MAATKASATADKKLATTLAAIEQSEMAERQAAIDSYQMLVASAAEERIELTPAGVIAILRRAGRTAEDLRSDAALQRELMVAEAEAATFGDRVKATAAAGERLAAAGQKYEEAMSAARQPVDAAGTALEAAQGQELSARQAKQRALQLRAEQMKREAARQGVKPNAGE